MISRKNMSDWLRSINFWHPISLSLSFSCVVTSILIGSIVVATFFGDSTLVSGIGSALVVFLGGVVVLAGLVCLSSKWMARKE